MGKAAHNVVVFTFWRSTERGGSIATCGGKEHRGHLFVEGVPIVWKEDILISPGP